MKRENATIKEFTDLLMEEFGLEKSERNKHKIRTKLVRTLKEHNYWDNLKTMKKGQLHIKYLDTYQQETVFDLLKDYMIKQSESSIESSPSSEKYLYKMNDFLSTKIDSSSFSKKLIFDFLKNNVSDEVTEMMEIKAMVKAIFNIFYEDLDLDRWEKDLLIRKYVENEEIKSVVEERLSKPEKYYTKKRDKYEF